MFFIFSIDDKDGTHLNGFNTSLSESSKRNMCYCTEYSCGIGKSKSREKSKNQEKMDKIGKIGCEKSDLISY